MPALQSVQDFQHKVQKKRLPFIEFEKDRRKIKPELITLFEDIQDGNILVSAVVGFLLALERADIIDEPLVQSDFIIRKLHISYKWPRNNHTSITFSLKNKTIAQSALKMYKKEGDFDYKSERD